MLEQTKHVRPELDACADLAQGVGLLEHLHGVALSRQHQRDGQATDAAASDDEGRGRPLPARVQRASLSDQRPPDSTARPSARNFNRCARSERAATGCKRSGTSL